MAENEHDEFDLMMWAERKREKSGVEVYATITITETFTVGLDGEDNARIEASEVLGSDRRSSVQKYVENLHKWGAEGQGSRNVVLSLKPA